MQQLGRRYPWRYALFMMAFFTFSATYNSFIGVYFKELSLSTWQISVLMAATPLVTVLTQPFWGYLGDSVKSRTLLLRLLSLGAAVAVPLFMLGNKFAWLLLVMALFSALYTSIQPLGDSIILESLGEKRRPFGPIRLVGSLTFALMSLLMGWLLEGRVQWVIPLSAAALALVFGGTFLLPHVGPRERPERDGGFLALVRQGGLLPLLILITLLQITMGYFYAFYSIHFLALEGATSALLGTSYLISSLCEVPFLLVFDWLFKKLGVGRLLISAALALTVRWLALGLSANVYVVMLTQALHGWGFIVMTTSMAKYVSMTVPDSLRARGQIILSIISIGLARIIGSLGGGLLAERVGFQGGFFGCAAVTVVALIAFGPKYLRMPPLNGQPLP